jgi:hypothetical protein
MKRTTDIAAVLISSYHETTRGQSVKTRLFFFRHAQKDVTYPWQATSRFYACPLNVMLQANVSYLDVAFFVSAFRHRTENFMPERTC